MLAQANRLAWLGNWNAAGPLYQIAEGLFKSEGNSSKEAYARIGRIRALGFSRQWADVSKALADQLELPIVRSDQKLRLWCLVSKGYVDLDRDIEASKRSWTEALQIANSIGESGWASRAQGELGIIAFLQGNTGTAVSLVGRALLSALASGDSGEQIRLLSMLGDGYNEVHRYKESLWFFQHAISIAESTHDAGFPFMAYQGSAVALSGLGRFGESQRFINLALAVARDQKRKDEESRAFVILGEVAVRLGDISAALGFFKEGGRIAGEGGFDRTLAQAMTDAATIYRQQAQFQAADKAWTLSLEASRRLGDTYYQPRSLAGLAEVKAAQRKMVEADRLFAKAEGVIDKILTNAHSRIASHALVDLARETYFEHFKLVLKEGNIPRAASLIEHIRSRSSASSLQLRENRNQKSSAVVSLESQIARLQLSLERSENQSERSAILDKLSQLERNLAFEEGEVGYQQPLGSPASLTEIQAALHADEEFVEYVMGDPHGFAIAVTKDSARIISLSARTRDIEELVKTYLDEIKSQPVKADIGLYLALLQPILCCHKSRLIIATDGVLARIPFEALRDSRGKYLVQSVAVTYVPTGSTICFQRRFGNRQPPPRTILALGDVDYAHAVAQSTLKNIPLPSMIARGLEKLVESQIVELPESRQEVLSVAAQVGGRSTILLGRQATEATFKSEPLSEFRVIHLAVHGVADSQYPERSSLILGVDSSQADDGLLQVREIMLLHLNADLVTLSACETGTSGEAGVISLGEAFLIAGSKAVVVSLWNVEDHSTTLLMKYFYSHLAQHEEQGMALANAKRDFIAQHPADPASYWAGFVMVGEGSSTIFNEIH